MTTLDDEELQSLQHEIQSLLGRCLMGFQQCEQLVKAMVAHHRVVGSIHDLERARDKQIDAVAYKTLGNLVSELLGSYVVTDEIGPPKETPSNFPEGVDWFAMQMTLSLPNEEFLRVENELRGMVHLRNNLVHHFFDQHDLKSLEGRRGARDALVTARSRIKQHFGQLREWAKDLENTRQAISEVLQSEEFKDVLSTELPPTEK